MPSNVILIGFKAKNSKHVTTEYSTIRFWGGFFVGFLFSCFYVGLPWIPGCPNPDRLGVISHHMEN